MSEFSGKCDCYDCLVSNGRYDISDLQKMEIYVGKNPLVIRSFRELIPYYPHLVVSSVCNNDKQIIHLSADSYVDREEQECLEFYLKMLITTYNRCKRKHLPCQADDLVRELGITRNDDVLHLLAKRVEKNGKKATVFGIHLPMHEHYRELLVQEMIKNGLNPIDYGYGRLLDE